MHDEVMMSIATNLQKGVHIASSGLQESFLDIPKRETTILVSQEMYTQYT